MKYKVEKNIPIPEKITSGSGRQFKYPFPLMEVGDSFFCEKKIGGCACNYGRKTGKKFSVLPSEGGGYRVWRIK